MNVMPPVWVNVRIGGSVGGIRHIAIIIIIIIIIITHTNICANIENKKRGID